MALRLLFLRQKPNDCRLIYRNGLFTAKITSTYSKFLSLTDSDRFNAEQTPKIPFMYSKFLSLIDSDRFDAEQTPKIPSTYSKFLSLIDSDRFNTEQTQCSSTLSNPLKNASEGVSQNDSTQTHVSEK